MDSRVNRKTIQLSYGEGDLFFGDSIRLLQPDDYNYDGSIQYAGIAEAQLVAWRPSQPNNVGPLEVGIRSLRILASAIRPAAGQPPYTMELALGGVYVSDPKNPTKTRAGELSVSWDGGQSSGSVDPQGANPTHTYPGPGEYQLVVAAQVDDDFPSLPEITTGELIVTVDFTVS